MRCKNCLLEVNRRSKCEKIYLLNPAKFVQRLFTLIHIFLWWVYDIHLNLNKNCCFILFFWKNEFLMMLFPLEPHVLKLAPFIHFMLSFHYLNFYCKFSNRHKIFFLLIMHFYFCFLFTFFISGIIPHINIISQNWRHCRSTSKKLLVVGQVW